MLKNQGFSVVAIIIILAVLVLGGGYWVWKSKTATPTPAPVTDTNIEPPTPSIPSTPSVDTAGWKTYRNEQYGFEFKYPTDWEQCTGIYPQSFLCVRDLQNRRNDVFGPDKLELLLVSDSYKNITSANQLKTYLESQKTEFGLSVVEKQIGEAKFVLAGGCDAGCNHRSLIFLKDGKLLELSYSTDGETSLTRDQILSTFRFVK